MLPVIVSILAVMTAPSFSVQLEDSREEIIRCNAWDDHCPRGMYCSTTSRRCWPCVICGYIDLRFHKRIDKCICDGGKDGDPFAICPFHPPQNFERDLLIRSLDDIPDDFRYRETWVYIFNGSQFANNCPKKPATTVDAITTAALSTSAQSSSEGPFGGGGPNRTVIHGTGAELDYKLTDHGGNSDTTSWNGAFPSPLIAAIGCFLFASIAVVLCILTTRKRRKERGSYEVRRDADEEIPAEDEGGTSFQMTETSASTLLEEPLESSSPLGYSGRSIGDSLELCDCKISEVTWTSLKTRTNVLLADEEFKRAFLGHLFRSSDLADDGFIGFLSNFTLDTEFRVIKEQTEIFGFDTYSILGGTLLSRELRGQFPAKVQLLDELLDALVGSHELCPFRAIDSGCEVEPLGVVSC